MLFNGNDFNDPASHEFSGGAFTFTPGYPPRAIETIAAYSTTGGSTIDRLIIIESGDYPSTMLEFSPSGTRWTETARFHWESTRPVDLVGSDGQVEQSFLRTHAGGEYISHGGFYESCVFRPGGGQPPLVVAMLQTLVVPGGSRGRAVIPRSEVVGWNRLFLLRVAGNRLEDAGTISDREGDLGINFIFCKDVNGDGQERGGGVETDPWFASNPSYLKPIVARRRMAVRDVWAMRAPGGTGNTRISWLACDRPDPASEQGVIQSGLLNTRARRRAWAG